MTRTVNSEFEGSVHGCADPAGVPCDGAQSLSQLPWRVIFGTGDASAGGYAIQVLPENPPPEVVAGRFGTESASQPASKRRDTSSIGTQRFMATSRSRTRPSLFRRDQRLARRSSHGRESISSRAVHRIWRLRFASRQQDQRHPAVWSTRLEAATVQVLAACSKTSASGP